MAQLWRNLLIVWALTGLWHGAAWTFVLWGLYFGLVIGLERIGVRRALASAPAAVPAPLRAARRRPAAGCSSGPWTSTRLPATSPPCPGSARAPCSTRTARFAFQRSWVTALVAVVLAAGAAKPFMDWVEGALTQHWHERPIESPLDAATTPLGIPDTDAGPVPHATAAREPRSPC